MKRAACTVLMLTLSSCGSSIPDPPTVESLGSVPPANGGDAVERTLAQQGLSADALDRSVNPCDDFYRFACGGWLDKTEIPSDKARWSRSFSEIHERNEMDLKQVLEDAAAKTKAGGADAALSKLGTFYATCMDEAGVEKAGIAPLAPLFEKIATVKDAKSLTAAVTMLHRSGVWAFFDIAPEQDFKDATKMIAFMDQNGLGLPDRDYYFNDDDKSKQIREDYLAHVERMFKLAGLDDAAAKAATADVMRIETALAKVSKTRVERRDPKGLYNKIDRAGVEKSVPKFDWKSYFEGLGHPALTDISVTAPKYFEGLNAVVGTEKPAAMRNYLKWQTLHSLASILSKPFVEEDFALAKTLTGQEEIQPRWKRCVSWTDDAMGELLAQPYIARRFPGKSKEDAQAMISAISEAFGKELVNLSWMDDATRTKAEGKREALAFLIGYPDKWKQYDFDVDDKAFATSVLRANAWSLSDALDKIGKPVDRSEWHMSPPTVNAYYHPLKNQMVFPAGILQPPFYSVEAGVAVNLGAMGMVVGHELTHGFDDQGAQFDRNGNLVDWWSPKVGEVFKAKTTCVEKLYGGYEPLPGVKLNGELTLGENIADMGGIKLAFRAYRALRKDQTPIVAEGFTEDQQFFLATGQTWCSKARDEYVQQMVQVDPHSHPRFRVNGPLSQMPEFAEAFSCEDGAKMKPADRCEVW